MTSTSVSRKALGLLLLSAIALGSTRDIRDARDERDAARGAGPYFLFSLFNGFPRQAQLATGVLTGSRGEITTTSRTGSKACQGASLLAVLGDNLPCVERKGLVVELAHQNLIPHSMDLDDASWGSVSTSAIVPDVGVAPDGTTTADRMDIAANGINQYLLNGGYTTADTVPYTFSIWVKGVSAAGTVLLMHQNYGEFAPSAASACAYTASAWTRCTHTYLSGSQGGTYVELGWFAAIAPGAALPPAESFYVWGAQFEAGNIAHTFVPTTGSAVTVQQDVVTVSQATALAATHVFSMDIAPLWSTGASGVHTLFDSRNAATSDSGLCIYILDDSIRVISDTASAGDGLNSGTLTWTAGQTYHVTVSWGGGNMLVTRDGVTVASGIVAAPSGFSSTDYLGRDYPGSGPFDGWVGNFTLGP